MAGDMFLGACLDLGMPPEVLREAISRLELPGIAFTARPAMRQGIRGLRFQVIQDGRPIEGPDPEEEAARESGTSLGSAPASPRPPSPASLTRTPIRRTTPVSLRTLTGGRWPRSMPC